MKRKMLIVITLLLGAVVLIFAGWYIMFVHFGRGPTFPFLQYSEIEIKEENLAMVADDQLLALVNTKEEAQEVAEQYGIEMRSFKNGIAIYHTEEDPYNVITRGQENGYVELSINFIRTLDESIEKPQVDQRIYQ